MHNKRLDLHGIRHADVKQLVIQFIEDNWESEEEDFEIITGHSANMKGIVLNVLDEYNLQYTVGELFNPLAPKIKFWIK